MNPPSHSISARRRAEPLAADQHLVERGAAFDKPAHTVAHAGHTTSLGRLSAHAAVIVGIVGLAATAWLVRNVLLLGFAGVLLALALRAGTDALAHRFQWSIPEQVCGC